MNDAFDIAVIGSGFAGSLLAMIARRLGRSVVLIERGRHPRFAIGESSTPLANLLLHDLARRYDLPRLLPLTKWGAWQAAYPHIGCGIKRGFSFYHHQLDEHFVPRTDRLNQLLVGASPNDRVADTQWYRPDFDAFLVNEAQGAGVQFVDNTALASAEWCGDNALLRGARNEVPIEFRARWVVDATGPRGFLHRTLELGERTLPCMPPTQCLYGHFTGVARLSENAIVSKDSPYPPEDAAVHHIFDGGWIWMLRFTNGVTSAGVAATDRLATRLQFAQGHSAWERILRQLPTVGKLFRNATQLHPITYAPSLSFRAASIRGPWWVMLPSAAGFVDPLLSTGFPLTLLGITRLAHLLEDEWDSNRFADCVDAYARQTEDELDATARLIGAMYHSMGRFRTFTSLAMLYFAAASYSEASHRLGAGRRPNAFLLHDHPDFGPTLRRLCEEVTHGGNGGPQYTDEEFAEEIRRAIDPINIAGLCDPARRNWYPADPNDLVSAAAKLGSTSQIVRQILGDLDESEQLTRGGQHR